jgi:PAS domain S-box-containing protein
VKRTLFLEDDGKFFSHVWSELHLGTTLGAAAALLATCAIMTVFEAAKQWLLPGVTIWISHLITICFSGFLAFLVSFTILRRFRSELVREKQVLETAHRQAEVFINAVPSILVGLNRESRVTRWNASAARVFGLREAEVVGKPLADCGIQWQTGMQEEIRLWSSAQVPQRYDLVSVEVSGETRLLGLRVEPAHMAGDDLTRTLLIGSDITERKRAEEEVRDLLDAIPEAVYGIDLQGRCTFCNPSCLRLLGYDEPEELLGLDMHALMHYSRADGTHYTVEECQICDAFRRGQGAHIDTEVLWRRDRTSFPAEYWSHPMHRGEELVGAVVTFVDITDRKRAERELRLTQSSLENASDAVFWVNSQARVMYANEAACQSLGRSREDLLSLSVSDIDALLPKEAWTEFWERIKIQGSSVFETQSKTKEGRIFPVEVTANYMEFDGQEFIFAFARDLTKRRAMESQLRQSQKLEGIGQLAAGIAHEINTPTQYIGDNVRFLQDAFQDLKSLVGSCEQILAAAKANGLSPEKVEEFAAAVEGADAEYLLEEIPKAIEQTLEGVSRVAGLVSAMKEFSHPGTKDRIPLDLNHAIKNTLTVSRNEWKYVADVVTDFDPALPLVPCLPGEFNQVILNLVVNAAHAIADVVGKGGAEKGKIGIQTRDCPECVEIRISDTGSGIPEKVRARIYEPFFTTKEIGKGTGQGLAIARSVVVDKHGGSIDFETQDGTGTTFIVRLPHDGKALAAKAV